MIAKFKDLPEPFAGFALLDAQDRRGVLVSVCAKIYIWQDAGRLKIGRAVPRVDRIEWDLEAVLSADFGGDGVESRH